MGPGSRNSGTTFLILSSLADGEKHGYALTKDVESFAGVRLAPGTLYEALARLEGMGLIEPVASDDRRRPYRLTAFGATALADHVSAQTKILAESQRRLKRNWSPA
jgi:DNA-binding PadR family transcriptional regulator